MLNVGYEINFSAPVGAKVLQHPLYQKYANQPALGSLDLAEVQADLAGCQMDAASAPIVAYLSWLIRCLQLVV